MALPPLASVEDLEARLGRTLADPERARAAVLLADASAVVRSTAGQEFTAGSSTVRLRVRGGLVRLPQEPATEVTAVEDLEGTAVTTWAWDQGELLSVDPLLEWVTVTYGHGYEELPPELVAITCQLAGRALGTAPDEGAYTGETIGSYTYQRGAAAAAGALGLLDEERAYLHGYRRVVGSARLGFSS